MVQFVIVCMCALILSPLAHAYIMQASECWGDQNKGTKVNSVCGRSNWVGVKRGQKPRVR